jgi:tripartite-type tricarboxylate transporter receptor subunit TctC
MQREAIAAAAASRAAAWVGASAFGVTSAVQTQTGAPGSSLRILCTAPGGTIPDIVARSYAEQLGASHSRGVVVDNRAGAAGRIAVGVLKQAAPDGSTLLLAQGAVASVYPYLYDTLAYDPVADLKPLSLAAEAVLGLAVGPAVPDSVTSLTSLVDWIRANLDKATHGSPGVGTLPHLMVALLARKPSCIGSGTSAGHSLTDDGRGKLLRQPAEEPAAPAAGIR